LPTGDALFLSGAVNTIDRHILREWLAVFALVLAATVGLLLIQAMYSDFRDLQNMGAGVADMAWYFIITIPGFLSFVLPVIVLISLLYALGQLHRGNEITAMRAAGLGVFRITRSIWLAGVALCGVMWVLNAGVAPRSVEASRALLEQMGFRREAAQAQDASAVGVTRTVTFDNQREGRLWFINRYSRFARRAYGVSVSELTLGRREKIRFYAEEAYYEPGRGGAGRGCWVFLRGRETWFDLESGHETRVVNFDERVMSYYDEDPALMLVFDVKPGDLSFFELRRIIRHFRIDDNPKLTIYLIRYYEVLASTLGPLIAIAIAIPFAMSGVRVNPAVGVSKSLGLFLLYFVLMKLATALGVRGTLDPLAAACAPGVAMLLIGAWFSARMR
jgi:lipopolysaccharide export system permease protein